MRKSGLFGRKGVTPGPNTQLSLHVEGANGQPTQAELDEEAEEVRHTPAALHPCRASARAQPARAPSEHAGMPGGAQAMNEMMGGIMERPKHVVRGGTPHTRVRVRVRVRVSPALTMTLTRWAA